MCVCGKTSNTDFDLVSRIERHRHRNDRRFTTSTMLSSTKHLPQGGLSLVDDGDATDLGLWSPLEDFSRPKVICSQSDVAGQM